ncbi:MAG: hypothetical protein H0X42_03810 [Solirubrobacterales bacterium]|nr:hypothetical protein [Solirubrobacterales bacterium]
MTAALCAGVGLVICSIANALSRETVDSPQLLYWAGVSLIVVPTIFRLCLEAPSTRERFALVALLAVSLYTVKVIRDPFLFTFPDEPIHAFNANQIVQTHHLFNGNAILPITSDFPGLGSATSALMTLTGMSSFVTGTILIGVARLTFALALFLLFSRISGSPRIAGLGVAIYAANSNFLSWGTQYAYESLSLPLLVVVLAALAEREHASPYWERSWAAPIVLGISAIVVTHHLTSYALVGLLVVLAIVFQLTRSPRRNPWPFALFALVASLGWLFVVASSTVGYLSPVLVEAFKDTIRTASGEVAPRTLFHSSSGSVIAETPLLARVISLAAVGLLGVGFLAGIRPTWRRRFEEPMTVLFCLGALGFFGALALRFAPAAWETGNRAGEFFFIGLAFVVTSGAVLLLRPGERLRMRRTLLVVAVGVSVVGGAITGWPWDSQLARPLRITADGRVVESESLELAHWASLHPPEGTLASLNSDSRLLLSVGNAEAKTDATNGIERILEGRKLQPWMLPELHRVGVRYVVADRRIVSNDNVRGYFFAEHGSGVDSLLPLAAMRKFARLPVGRIYDSGHIVVYDLRDRR